MRAMRPMPAATRPLHGRRDRDVHALQVEINRALYLDEERIERGPDFEEVRHRLTAALAQLVADRAVDAGPQPAAARISRPSSRAIPRKKAAPEGAAKFREETPRKGGGITNGRSVMPRCNNMDLLP